MLRVSHAYLILQRIKGFNFTKYYFRKWYSFNPRRAIYAGGNVTLLDSQILNSQAPKGGAIFLGGVG